MKASEIYNILLDAGCEKSGMTPEEQRASPDRDRRDVASPGRNISIHDDRIDSRDLFIGTREIIIAHGGEAYRLRLTAQNKLILTK
jgi:hemin uptake protein HemP